MEVDADDLFSITGDDIEGALLERLRSATEVQIQNAHKAVATSMKLAFDEVLLSCAQACARSLRKERETLSTQMTLLEQTPKTDYDQTPISDLSTMKFFPEENVVEEAEEAEEVIDSGEADLSVEEVTAKNPALGRFLRDNMLKGLNSMTEGSDNLSTNWNALHCAVYHNRDDMIRALIENPDFKGLNALTSNGTSSLLGACVYGHVGAVGALLKCTRYKMINETSAKLHPLTAALSRGDTAIVKLLLEDPRTDVKLRSPMGSTVLHVAIPQVDIRISEMVLNHPDIDANERNKIGQTALHMAITKESTILMLNSKRFNVPNAQDTAGRTALHTAVIQKKQDVAEALLESRFFTAVNAADKSGWTAIHVAAMKGDTELVETFLNISATHEDPVGFPTLDFAKTDMKGRSAMDLAREKGHTAVIDLLSRKRRREDTLRPASKIWQVVGGIEHGGILVREGHDITSAVSSERLGVNATVEEIEKRGNRLHYRKLRGTGPETGWVNCQHHNIDIIKKLGLGQYR